ncbi:MAG: hypothetical protein H6672_13860 [Anaerolineaceae bacterium]|nr:hypothetical protein [Anaerolineaceae bacterium]
MEFFKKLFSSGKPADSGLYLYVKPARCDEVVRVRLDQRNDFSLMDNGRYYARKLVRANDWRCNQTVELEVTFNHQRSSYTTEINGGTLVSAEDYDAWEASSQEG